MNHRRPWFLSCFALSTLALAAPVLSAPCDLDAAKAFHAQAKSAQPAERVALLRQAWSVCNEPRIGYDLGLALLGAGDLDGALAQFLAARDAVSATGAASARLRPAIQARIAETYLARGEIGRAEAEIGFAESFPGGDENPVVVAVRRAIDTAPERQLMSADQIGVAMAAQRAAGVSERVSLFILFDYDQDSPNAEGDRQVTELGKALLPIAKEGRRILLVGHSDTQGEEVYNQGLSERRAKAVEALLVQRQPALAGTLEARGRGEQRPRYKGDSEEDHRLNRRVEVVVLDAR